MLNDRECLDNIYVTELSKPIGFLCFVCIFKNKFIIFCYIFVVFNMLSLLVLAWTALFRSDFDFRFEYDGFS